MTEERRHDYTDLKIAINKIDEKLDHCVEQITTRFDSHKDNFCIPAGKEIETLKVKSGIFGILGGALIVLGNYIIKRY
jgi:hypothetical protein